VLSVLVNNGVGGGKICGGFHYDDEEISGDCGSQQQSRAKIFWTARPAREAMSFSKDDPTKIGFSKINGGYQFIRSTT
jgi:hypothetical protein